MDERIKKVLCDVMGVEMAAIDDRVSVDTLESWDSLRHMTLVVALEEEFAIEFDNDEIVDMISYPLIKEIIREKKAKDAITA